MRDDVTTAVLPVAGLGTRFLPVTKVVPKELLPLVDRPCIEYIVAEAVAAGIERIVFVSARGKDALVDYFDRAPNLEAHLEAAGKRDLLAEVKRVAKLARVVVVRQQEILGLGHAVGCARPAVGDRPFAVLLGDDIMDSEEPALAQLMAGCPEGGAAVALVEVPPEDTARYGICAGTWLDERRMQVSQMVEKPSPHHAPSNCAIIGRYVLPPDIFEIIERTPRGRGGEVQLTDALAVLAGQDRVVGVTVEGRRFDTGTPLGLLRAAIHFARKRPELREGMDAILAEFSAR